ncbi:MAG: hypothetical protein VKK03_09545 [Synechococcus sp.]|nr:hypothetical protein [Synechococcus sp.]
MAWIDQQNRYALDRIGGAFGANAGHAGAVAAKTHRHIGAKAGSNFIQDLVIQRPVSTFIDKPQCRGSIGRPAPKASANRNMFFKRDLNRANAPTGRPKRGNRPHHQIISIIVLLMACLLANILLPSVLLGGQHPGKWPAKIKLVRHAGLRLGV